MYKFRTMYVGADKDQMKLWHLNEADGPVFKIYDDPRFTKFGKWLARTGLDELPQLINVVRGEMSLVGPRPLPPREEEKIPLVWREKRRIAKPGITSSWAIRHGRSLSFKEWMELDIKDIQEKSLPHDLVIVFKTLKLLFQSITGA